MRRPTERQIEQAIERIENGGRDNLVAANTSTPDEVKVLIGVELDRFSLPDQARAQAKHATETDTEASVVVKEDMGRMTHPSERTIGIDLAREFTED